MPKKSFWKKMYKKIGKIDKFFDSFSFVGSVCSIIGLTLVLSQKFGENNFNSLTSTMVGQAVVQSSVYKIYIIVLGALFMTVGLSFLIIEAKRK